MVLANIIKGKTIVECISVYPVSDFIAWRVLQMTLFNMEHFIKSTGNMKTECFRSIVEHLARSHFFPSAPFLVREGVFHLIPIAKFLL